MAAIRNIELLSRPSKRDKYSIIIPAAGVGRRMKIYGPKSLTPIWNTTIVHSQIQKIRECFRFNEIIIIGGYQIDKLKKNLDSEIILLDNNDYENNNVLHSINIGLQAVTTNKVILVYGDLVFNSECINLPFYKQSGVVIVDSMKDEEVGCIINNNVVEHIFYKLSNKWAQISYFTNKELDLLKKVSSHHGNWFGFEAINEIINLGGTFKSFMPKNGKSIDIDCTFDLKKLCEF